MDHCVRVELVLEVSEPGLDALYLFARLHAEAMVEELWANGIVAEIVSIGTDGERRYG